MALGVGGFSSVEAERSVRVAVVGDEAAYLGIPDRTLRCGKSQNALFYNQFPETVTDGEIEVTVGSGDLVVKRGDDFVEYHDEFTIDIEENITAGEGMRIHLKPTNGSANSITTDIEVSGPGFDASTTAARSVDCEKQPVRAGGGPPEGADESADDGEGGDAD